MKILFLIKRHGVTYYVCVYDCGLYSIERNTRGFGRDGGAVAYFKTLEELIKYASRNEYRRIR